uniref:Uncharacterized protein n=1 Tax=Solanum tuberosum TaxID=4113 RepID=M1E0G7_SOLTU
MGGLPSETMANPKNEVEVWKVLFEKVQGGEQQIQSVSHRRGRRTRPNPPFDSRHLQIGVCKIRRTYEIIGESPTMSVILTETVVGTPTLTGGSVKFGEGVAGLNLRSWVENRHVGPFDELGRARRTIRRFA